MNQIVDWEQIAEEEQQRLAALEKKSAVKRWAKYPRPNPFTEVYGYGSTLYKLRGDMDNYELTPITRRDAARNYYKILQTVQNKPLMRLRQRLIKATQAGNNLEANKISKQMRFYTKEDQETGMED